MSATKGDGPNGVPPTGFLSSEVVHVDLTELAFVAPGVSVLASRRNLHAPSGRIVLTEPPMVRRVNDIPGLQILIDIAVASRADIVPAVEAHGDVTIHADDLHPGDVIDYCGHLHRVTKVDRGEGWSWPVASDDEGWAMALSHDLIVLHRHAR